MADLSNWGNGMPGWDSSKGGTIARARKALNEASQGSMTKAEYESYQKRKALEDEAQARRDAAAGKSKSSAASDLMGKMFGN